MQYLRGWAICLGSEAGSERGQVLIEYALVLVLVSVVAVAGLSALGGSVQQFFDQANDVLDAVVKHGHCGHKACKP
jgi:Flp pilus assembly pilin Flp